MSRGDACMANIGPRGRQQRMRFGLVVLAATLPLAALMIAFIPARAPRAFLMLPLWMAALGIFQARGKT